MKIFDIKDYDNMDGILIDVLTGNVYEGIFYKIFRQNGDIVANRIHFFPNDNGEIFKEITINRSDKYNFPEPLHDFRDIVNRTATYLRDNDGDEKCGRIEFCVIYLQKDKKTANMLLQKLGKILLEEKLKTIDAIKKSYLLKVDQISKFENHLKTALKDEL